MEIAETEEPVSWLKQQPQHYPTRHPTNANSKLPSNKRISAMIQGQDILPRDRRPASPAWSNPDMTSPSSTPTTSSSTATFPQKIFSMTPGSVHSFLPRLDLDLGPVMMMHPRDNEDEEDDDEDDDGLFSGQSSPSSTSVNLYRRIRSLEEQLDDSRRQASAYQELLAQQERTTQQLVAKYIEEKETESVRVNQLVALLEMQEQLIQSLQEIEPPATAPPPTSSSSSSSSPSTSVHAELAQLRQDLDALSFEKRSLETRMAAFLHDELDVSKVSLLSNDDDELYTIAALGYRSSSSAEPVHPDGLSSQIDLHRRSSSILLDTDQYSLMAFGSPRNASERITSLGSTTRHTTNQSVLNLVEEEDDDAVSAYSSIAASSLAMSFSSPTSSMGGSGSGSADPRFSYLKSSPLRNSVSSVSSQQAASAAAANAARKAAWARIMIPPATPPPNHPLPPIPPKDRDSIVLSENEEGEKDVDDDLSAFCKTEPHQAYNTATVPRSHRSCSPPRTQSSPLAMAAAANAMGSKLPPPIVTKHQSIDTLSDTPDSSLTSAPPVLSYQAAALQTAISDNSSETSQATAASSSNGDMVDDRQGFWKGMKKKWKMK